MFENNLIEQTCEASAPGVPSEFSVDTIDRYGNVLPTIIVNSNTTFNWKARDFRDNFLSQMTNSNSTKELAIENLSDGLIAAGLLSKFRGIWPIIGDNAEDNSLNLSYPYNQYSQKITWIGSPTHSTGSVQGNGTTSAGLIGLSSFDSNPNDYSLGFYSLQLALSTIGVEIGFGNSWDNGTYLHLNTHPSIGSSPAFCNKAYFNKLQFTPSDGSGLYIGNVNAATRNISRNGTILVSSAINLGMYTSIGAPLTVLYYNGAFSPRKHGFFFFGEYLTNPELVILNTIIQNFITEKGAVII